MPLITANDIQTSYVEKGNGFPLILLHGLSDDLNLWSPLLPTLSGRWRTIALDIRGHGHSGKPEAPYSIGQFSDDLLAFMRGMEIERAHLLGLSMGAAVAQQFAIDHPGKTGSLVLLSAFDHADDYFKARLLGLRDRLLKEGVAGFFDEAVKLVVSVEFISRYSAAIEDSRKYCVSINSAPALVRAIDACLKFDVRTKVSSISSRMLVISGKEDVFSRVNLAEDLHRSVRGSKWLVMDGVGHNVLTPENVDPLGQAILTFLS